MPKPACPSNWVMTTVPAMPRAAFDDGAGEHVNAPGDHAQADDASSASDGVEWRASLIAC
jgi:hypothetical protein